MNTPENSSNRNDPFNDFLRESEQSYEVSSMKELEREEAMRQSDELIDELGITTPFQFDEAKAIQAEQAIINQCHSELNLQGKPLDDAAREEIMDELNRLMTRDGTIVASTVLAREMAQRGEMASAEAAKKNMMAKLHVESGFGFDHPWMTYVDRMIPGDRLDPANIDDLRFITNAQKMHDTKISRLVERDMVLQDFLERFAGDQSQDEVREEFLNWKDDCLTELLGPDDDPEYEQALETIVRRYGRPQELVEEFVTTVRGIFLNAAKQQGYNNQSER